MKNNILIRKLDKLGRITIPSEVRKNLNLEDFEELEIITDGNKLIIRKQSNPDVFGNIAKDGCYFEYHGNKVAKSSIIELSRIAGIIE